MAAYFTVSGSLTALPRAQLDEHLLTPAAINSIEVHGASNTRRSILDRIFKPLVEGPENLSSTLGESLERVGAATRRLSRFGASVPLHQELRTMPNMTFT